MTVIRISIGFIKDDDLIAELDRDVSSFEVKNLKPDTNYFFRISAVSAAMREGPQSNVLSISTDPVTVTQVNPAEYLASRNPPTFKNGHTLLPLSTWSWPYSYDTKVELARWGYALEFWDVNANTASKLDNPNSDESKLVTLVNENPKLYQLSVNIPRDTQRPNPIYSLHGR